MADQSGELVTYGEACEQGAEKPLRVTARLSERIVLRNGIMLDSLLAWVVAAQHRLLKPMPGEEVPAIEIPIKREPQGRFHLCSQGLFSVEASETCYKNRRAPWREIARLGSKSVKRIDISVGVNKSYRVPYSAQILRDDEITWYCVGDAERIMNLLRHVHYLGRFRGAGKGRLDLYGEPWRIEEVEPWGDGFPVLDAEGRPLRQLPVDYPGLATPVKTSFRVLSYPYYDQTRAEFLAVP